MKKVLVMVMAALGLSILAGCSDISGHSDDGEYGSITVSSASDSRKIVNSELSISSVKVYGYNVATVSGSGNVDKSSGSGTATVNGIKVGRRVVEVKSNTGAVLYAVKDVVSGPNNVEVSWDTTAAGAVYYELSKTEEIKNIEKSEFASAIDTTKHASLIDAAAIAADYKAGSLKAASNYVKAAKTVTVKAYGYSGKSIQIADPVSEAQTASSDEETLTFTNVCPGKWSVFADGIKVKTVDVTSEDATVSVGNAIGTKTIIFVKAASAPSIWVWEPDGVSISEVQNYTWNTQPSMSAVEDGYMNDSTGWFMYDVTGVASGKQMTFILNKNGSGVTDTVCTKTFWYDGSSFYAADPTTPPVPSSDTSVSSIKINGTDVTASLACEVANSVTEANVEVTTTDSKATYTVSSTTLVVGANTITVTVTAEDETTKNYTITVTRKEPVVDDVSLASVTVNGAAASGSGSAYTFSKSGSDDSLAITGIIATATDSSASVTYSTLPASVASGTPATVTITVKNGAKDATYTLTISYTKQTSDLPAPYYGVNTAGVGKSKTITVDGDGSDWSEDMQIANSAAWDVANHWKGGHENCVLDITGLFAAWDDTNLYLGIQMVNTTDTWADREGDGPLSDGGAVLDVPIIVGLNVGNKPKTTGELSDGKYVWGDGVKFSNGTDHLFYMSGKPGLGKPSMFTADSTGYTDYDDETRCQGFKNIGVEYKVSRENICSKIYGLNNSESTDDVKDANADWVDYKTYAGGKRAHKTSYDTFYEMKIPLAALEITKADLESKGIEACVVATRGESGLDCIPFDPAAMLDNATGDYAADASTSAEKNDLDEITVPMARIGK